MEKPLDFPSYAYDQNSLLHLIQEWVAVFLAERIVLAALNAALPAKFYSSLIAANGQS